MGKIGTNQSHVCLAPADIGLELNQSFAGYCMAQLVQVYFFEASVLECPKAYRVHHTIIGAHWLFCKLHSSGIYLFTIQQFFVYE